MCYTIYTSIRYFKKKKALPYAPPPPSWFREGMLRRPRGQLEGDSHAPTPPRTPFFFRTQAVWTAELSRARPRGRELEIFRARIPNKVTLNNLAP